MKNKMQKVFCVIVISLFLSSCIVTSWSPSRGLRGEGNPETYFIKVGDYNRIRVEGYSIINFYDGRSDTIRLEIQPNLRDHYEVIVRNSVLILRPRRGVNFLTTTPPVVTVTSADIIDLTMTGASVFTTQDTLVSDTLRMNFTGAGRINASLDVNTLDIEMSGAGTIDLDGRADSANFRITGAGRINTTELLVKDANVRMTGSGRAQLNVSDSLSVNGSGTVMVEYLGSPQLNVRTSGLSRVRRLE